MPRQVDDEERKAELYEFRAALAFLVVMFVLVVGGLCLINQSISRVRFSLT
jgi:hypothetical protein